ncbi:MAG: ADP-forming succinate--CoA ligase subunit beta [Bacteroidales bacterium]|nr:ADP-forming succinate--CoA ligase subunit beta [Lentimicrobiaceae bacterium]MDD5695384.1 ADP-forming succinate--CoA ligase subunit beta [Bacteroidales bacterium]
MNLHEYQGKSILKKYGVLVPEGMVAFSPDEAVDAAWLIREKTGVDKWAVKAQIHAGGRGKGGGVRIAGSFEEVKEHAKNMIGMMLVTPQTGPEGKKVGKVLVEQNIHYKGESPVQEFYMSILLNRNSGKYMIVYSPRGGMNIEQVAEETPDQIFREEIESGVGIKDFQCRKIAFNLGLSGKAFKEMNAFVKSLYKAFTDTDASLFEINPVFKTSDNRIFAADAKVVIDDNAVYRHPDIHTMRDLDEEDPIEVEASKFDLNYIKLNGNIGCMVNGAGLAMATMDIIKLSGGEPANFLDVGGSASTRRVEEAFRIILQDPNVEGILLNIFGGIVRCDIVAQGVVDACNNIGEINVPIIVRLQGTNAKEGKEIIDRSGLKVYSAMHLQEAAELVTKILQEQA